MSSNRPPLLATLTLGSIIVVSAAVLAGDPAREVRQRGRLYVLAVGVEPELSRQKKPDPYARDAEFVRKALVSAESLYESVHSRLVTGPRATCAAVQGGLAWLARETDADAVSVLFFSVHGGHDEKGYSLSLAGAEGTDSDALAGSELCGALAKIRGRVIVFVDACESGALAAPELASVHSATVIAACRSRETSSGQEERSDRPHGYFVIALCEALSGLADTDQNGLVTLSEIESYIGTRSRALARRQTPVIRVRPEYDDIALARVDAGSTPQQLWTPPLPRNPFGETDVDDPDGEDVRAFAKKITLTGGDKDPNAEAWCRESEDGTADSFDGDWESRWRGKTADEPWHTGTARVKCVAGRIHILARHDGSTYLIELRRDEKGGVAGRYVNVESSGDTTPWAGRIVSPERIDGRWSGGRWDLRRKLKPSK
jgi:hypothetical protein